MAWLVELTDTVETVGTDASGTCWTVLGTAGKIGVKLDDAKDADRAALDAGSFLTLMIAPG